MVGLTSTPPAAIALAGILLLCLVGCVGPPEPWVEGGDWYVLMPGVAPIGRSMPGAILGDRYRPPTEAVTNFTIRIKDVEQATGKVRYDAGYFEFPALAGGSFYLELSQQNGYWMFARQVEARRLVKRTVGGTLSSATDLAWEQDEIIEVVRDLTVPAGSVLTVSPGALVFIHPGVNIEIAGRMTARGRSSAPVTFLPEVEGSPWGGIYLDGGRADFEDCIITGGGGDSSRVFGHSGSQPVIGGRNAAVTLTHTAVVNNPGKAFGLTNSTINIDRSLIQRCDTGGEFAACRVTIDGSWFLEMPNDDAMAVDDDNDALYFNGIKGTDTSMVRESFFVIGKDDAIDHNGALLVVSDCLISGFDNEGLAGSNAQYVRIENCYITNCEQGIEAGYGTPTVEVNHCTIRRCDTGLRFGDWYNLSCNGRLSVRNTISIDNRLHNVWNHDLATGGPVSGAIDITYSLVNDTAYNSGRGCITGLPVIDDFGVISTRPHQPGWRAGSDTLDMGRLVRWPPR